MSLQDELEQLNIELEDAKTDLEDKKDRLSDIESELQELEDEKWDVEDDIDSLKIIIKEAEDAILYTEKQIEAEKNGQIVLSEKEKEQNLEMFKE